MDAMGVEAVAWVRTLRRLLLVLPLAASACAQLAQNGQGPLQPQMVRGPCQVKKFFLLNLRAVPTDMTVSNTGEACSFTIFNPDLQIVTTAALVTVPASHGRATASRIEAGYQAEASYTPAPGYAGPDGFTITLEPSARGIEVRVVVQPATPAR